MADDRRGRRPKHPLDCHERALRLLSVRPRSRRELELRLLRAGFDPGEVSGELDRLEVVGLIDDERFAREFAEHQFVTRRAGRRAVASGLAAKGVDRQAVERALAEAAGDDAERADNLARSRVGRLRGLAPERAFARLVSFLVRRGHDPETARRAARSALGLDGGQV
ncbi:MAG TPA: regulatory protein RecX [Actinomycetota bacterium]|nr:regulatory protein RecX [Actinomycetota bacterium]